MKWVCKRTIHEYIVYKENLHYYKIMTNLLKSYNFGKGLITNTHITQLPNIEKNILFTLFFSTKFYLPSKCIEICHKIN